MTHGLRGGVDRLHRLATWLWRFPGTVTLTLVTLGMFAVQVGLGGMYDIPTATRLGALLAERVVDDGEYFRLVMPMFLHVGPVHLGLNMLAFVQLGLLTEYVWGTRRLVVFYGLCGVGAALVTATFSPVARPTIGASGAVMGLAGLLLGARYVGTPALRLFLGEVLGRRLFWGVLITFLIGLVLEAFFPIVDNWGHLGGFLLGVLLALATPDPDSGEWPVAVVAGMFVPVFSGAAAWTMLQGGAALDTLDADLAWQYRLGASQRPDSVQGGDMLFGMVKHYEAAGMGDEGVEVLAREVGNMSEPLLLQRLAGLILLEGGLDDAAVIVLERWAALDPHDPQALNSLAWQLVIHADPDVRDPARAEALVRKALRRVEDPESSAGRYQRAAYLDTLGEALLQRGQLDDALKVQSESLTLAEELDAADLPDIRARHEAILKALGSP